MIVVRLLTVPELILHEDSRLKVGSGREAPSWRIMHTKMIDAGPRRECVCVCVKIATYQVILRSKHFLLRVYCCRGTKKNQQIVSCDGRFCRSCSSPIIPNISASIMASTDDPRRPQSAHCFLAVSEAPKRPNTRPKSSWLSTKMSRNSSMTSKSRSIPIFVHVGDLLKHPGSSPKFPPDQETNEHASEVEQEPVQSSVGTSRTIPIEPHPEVSRGAYPAENHSKDDPDVEVTMREHEKARSSEETKPTRNTKSIYSLFPEPPDPLEHFDKW
jgi:hypothetical protein